MVLPDFNTQSRWNIDRSKCEKSDEITVIYVCFYEVFGQVYELELRGVRILEFIWIEHSAQSVATQRARGKIIAKG